MNLAEVHLPRGPFRHPPEFDSPLQRPDLPVAKPPWVLPLQPLKQRLGLQTWALFHLLLDRAPHLAERFDLIPLAGSRVTALQTPVETILDLRKRKEEEGWLRLATEDWYLYLRLISFCYWHNQHIAKGVEIGPAIWS
jgi:hypothetical protein